MLRILEPPHLGQGILWQEYRREFLSQFFRDLHQQRACESIVEKCSKAAVSVTVSKPYRRFQAECTKFCQGLRREKIINDNHAAGVLKIRILYVGPIPTTGKAPFQPVVLI